jgi:hypothetical protein
MAVGLCALFWAHPAGRADGREWFVASGGSGTGSSDAPFGRIQDALNVAEPGDTISVRAGTYRETLRTIRGGSASQRIVLRGNASEPVVVTTRGRVLTVSHPYITVESLVLDGEYGADDTVRIGTDASHFTLRHAEVRHSGRDLIDLTAPPNVTIEDSLLHHALNSTGGRSDAHGIVAGPVQDLVVRNTEIHTFSGDAVQVDPGRSAPGWNRVLIDGCRFWLAPLDEAENGFAAGTVPGENAVDTKARPGLPRAVITIRNTTAAGFRGGLLSNMAAFNLKENVEATLDGVTVFDSEIAFRLRGPTPSTPAGAHVTIMNALVYDVATAFRYENDIEVLHIWNTTLGRGIGRTFQAASSDSKGIDVQNGLFLGALPREAVGPSNLAVGPGTFTDVSMNNYLPLSNAMPVDAGVSLIAVQRDRVGIRRPQGKAFDVGAYEIATQP